MNVWQTYALCLLLLSSSCPPRLWDDFGLVKYVGSYYVGFHFLSRRLSYYVCFSLRLTSLIRHSGSSRYIRFLLREGCATSR